MPFWKHIFWSKNWSGHFLSDFFWGMGKLGNILFLPSGHTGVSLSTFLSQPSKQASKAFFLTLWSNIVQLENFFRVNKVCLLLRLLNRTWNYFFLCTMLSYKTLFPSLKQKNLFSLHYDLHPFWWKLYLNQAIKLLSWMLSVSTILRPRVRIPSTPSIFFSIIIIEIVIVIGIGKGRKRGRDWPIYKSY